MGLLGKVRSALAGVAVGIRASMGGGRAYSETVGWSPDRSNVMYWAPADSRQHLPAWTRAADQRQGRVALPEFRRGQGRRARHRAPHRRPRPFAPAQQRGHRLERGWRRWTGRPTRSRSPGATSPAGATSTTSRTWPAAQRLKQGEFLAAWAANPRWKGEVSLQAFDASEIRTPDGMGPGAEGVRRGAGGRELRGRLRTTRLPRGWQSSCRSPRRR